MSWLAELRKRRTPEPPRPVEVRNAARATVLASRVLVANRGSARRKGLLGRPSLGPDEGLWIVPCEAVHTFWMRFAIDLVYLDRNRRVVKLRRGVPPWRLSGSLKAHSVLELAPGAIDRSQTDVGDLLDLSL
jgi:uncharacterized membrane protein (UPF0127 family)